MNRFYLSLFLILGHTAFTQGQDTLEYKLRLSIPIVEFPQNATLPHHFPSMSQSLELSNDFYELSFRGIEVLGNKLIKPKTKFRKLTNNVLKYAISLGFSKYGSELPIPLGVWGHEEFHRSVLGVKDISSKNGNWLFNRWDGTVYGVSDLTLGNLKSTDPDYLLYSYVAGVQYEILSNEKNTLGDFYKRRSMTKAALLLYNAWYVYDYFRFSTSDLSDSAKILAPPDESKNPVERDFAGADLTAWIYDMFNPDLPFASRDGFPDGDGVNRRIGFSDLTEEEQDYLVKQKKLSLLNFLNPSLLFINQIRIDQNLSFNFFMQYSPTYFGNDIALFLPVRYKKYDLLVNVHNYSNKSDNGFGLGLGIFNYKITNKFDFDILVNAWNQPKSFFENDKFFGGNYILKTKYGFSNNFNCFIQINGKTAGWMLGNPYLNNNTSVQFGINYHVYKG